MTASQKNIREKVSAGKYLSIVLMLFCLTLLTSINYFLYPSEQATENVAGNDERESKGIDFPPSGTPEEKSCNPGFSIVEEILHENHPEIDFRASNHLYLHHIAEADKIEMFHPEQLSPPPKQIA